MADKIISQDPTTPGVNKLNGPTLAADNTIPLAGLSTAGAAESDVVTLQGGAWTAAPGGGSSSDTASNVGGGAEVFKEKVVNDFRFRSILAGTNITVTQNTNDIEVEATVPPVISGVVMLSDVKPGTDSGGTFTSGAWQTRVLNTIQFDTVGGVTLVANQFVLPAGTYLAIIRAPGYAVNNHLARLYNITDAATVVGGSSTFATPNGVGVQTDSWVIGRFTIAASKTFEVQHQCLTTKTGDGFGISADFGININFTEVLLFKE